MDYHKKQFAQTVINELQLTGCCYFTDKDGVNRKLSFYEQYTLYYTKVEWYTTYSKADIYKKKY